MQVVEQLQHQLDVLCLIEKSFSEQTEKIGEIDELVGTIDQKSSDLFGKCNVILKKKNTVERDLDGVRKELRYFEAFDDLSMKMSNPKSIDLYSSEFKKEFNEISQCIEYFHLRKTDSTCYTYLLKYQQLKSKILSFLSIFIKKQIDSLHSNCKSLPVLPLAQFTVSALYPSPVPNQFASLIQLLRSTTEKSILVPYTKRFILALEQINSHPSVMTKEGGAYLFTIFYKEGKQFKELFNQEYHAFNMMLSEIFDVYSNRILELCYQCHDISILCLALTYLRDDQTLYRLPLSKLKRIPEYPTFASCAESLALDISERLLHLSLVLVNNLIVSFVPTQNDLDYPAIFTSAHVADLPFKLVLFPPVANTLTLLSKLHFALTKQSFSDIACTAVTACVDIVISTIDKIGESGSVDGKLFALRNLCILRDQIVPFEDIEVALRKVEATVQELCGDICNSLLRIVAPKGVELLRSATQNEEIEKTLFNEYKNGINNYNDWISKINIYLHQVHAKELIEIFKARIVYFAHKLSVFVNDEGFEKKYLDMVIPLLFISD
ncbi:Conserved oligomeric Golgi complex subunit 3 [Entamoeba marina]